MKDGRSIKITRIDNPFHRRLKAVELGICYEDNDPLHYHRIYQMAFSAKMFHVEYNTTGNVPAAPYTEVWHRARLVREFGKELVGYIATWWSKR